LAEALRRNKKYSEAEHYALMAVHNDPRFYLPWVTLGSILMERKKEIEEARKCIMKGYELSKKEKRMVTVNVLLSFINDYLKNSDKDNIVITIRKIQSLVYGSSKYDKL
jgi:tetratricopeptide (TPR) repeat protein